MTFNEKVAKLLNDRVNALVSLKGVGDAEDSFNEEADFNNQYLFGDGTNLGIVNFFELYYKEMNLAVGRTATTPTLHIGVGSTKTSWINQFRSAATLAGDGSLYLDSNSDGVADDEINLASAWLHRNGDQGQSTPVISSLEDTYNSNTILGVSASATANDRTDGVLYDTIPLAESAAQSKAEAEQGIGLLGKRTQNSDSSDNFSTSEMRYETVTVVEDVGDPPVPTNVDYYQFFIGANGADHPDYYNEPFKTALENNLSSSISALQSYYDHLLEIETAITAIDSETNTLFTESDMNNDINSSTELININSQKIAIGSALSDFQDELDYFSSFTASDDISSQTGYDRTTFNNKLNNIIPTLYSTVESYISSRIPQIETLIDLDSSPSDEPLSFRKWLLFWVEQNIRKPISPYIGLNGIGTARSNQEALLSGTNNTLNTLFGDPTKYFPTPVLSGTFLNPKIDENGLILQQRVNLLWLGSPASNKYKIFRAKRGEVAVSNDNWTDAYLLAWQVELNENSGSIEIQYLDTSFDANEKYIYRVQMFDTTSEGPPSPLEQIDSFESSSLQSKIYDDENEITTSSITSGRMTVSEGHGLSRGNWILVKSDNLAVEEFYQIDAATEDTIILSSPINAGSSKIYKAFGVITT